VTIEHRLALDGDPIGRPLLEVRLDELARQMRLYAWFAIDLGALTLAIALAVALGLQGRIARPILQLADAARAVTQRQDFWLRVPAPDAEDEIGTLVESFNLDIDNLVRLVKFAIRCGIVSAE
jgi:nitrogen fixation/metabolism regulation signal transduction histidine kinase